MAIRTRKAFGATILVVSTGDSYHTHDDWELTIENNDYIGDPVVETKYLDVMGRHGRLDYSTSLTGRPVYKSRPINMQMAGLRESIRWDIEISKLRNILHGQLVRVYFDNDGSHYYEGRMYLQEQDHEQKLGKCTLSMPEALPHKYDAASSIEDYDWDTFDFEEDTDRYIGTLTIVDSYELVIPEGNEPVVPVINVTRITSDTLTVTSSDNNRTYTLVRGRNRFPSLVCAGANEVTFTFTGSGTLNVDYRAMSL